MRRRMRLRMTRLFSAVASIGLRRLLVLNLLAYNLIGCEMLMLPLARADVGGEQYSPGQCPYPAVGAFGLDGVAQHYVCDYPTEINGSKHHCVYGGAAATVGANISLLIFSASIGTSVGVLEGICYWACPDGSVAGEPNPVQTWQGSSTATAPVKRSKCVPVAANPIPPEPAAVITEQPQPAVLPQQREEPGGAA